MIFNKEKISVVMCTYNGGQYLREQLDSIINQTYPVEEIIVQDDCSDDNTIDIVKEYQEEYPYIKLFVNEHTLGVNGNFFSALDKANGDYIAISDQDDIWYGNKIEEQMNIIGNNLLCFHFSKPFSSDGVPVWFDERVPNFNIIRMIHFNMIPGHTMLLKKELLSLLPDKSVFLYDALLAIAAGVYGRIVFVNRILVNHRRYSNAYSYHSPVNSERKLNNVWRYVMQSVKVSHSQKENLQKHFEAMYTLLSKFEDKAVEPNYFLAKKLALIASKLTFLNKLKMSFFCLKVRKEIFYTKESNEIIAIVRALLHPFLLYKYYK